MFWPLICVCLAGSKTLCYVCRATSGSLQFGARHKALTENLTPVCRCGARVAELERGNLVPSRENSIFEINRVTVSFRAKYAGRQIRRTPRIRAYASAHQVDPAIRMEDTQAPNGIMGWGCIFRAREGLGSPDRFEIWVIQRWIRAKEDESFFRAKIEPSIKYSRWGMVTLRNRILTVGYADCETVF